MRGYSVSLSILLMASMATAGFAQGAVPILKYDPPPNFLEASYGNYEDFSSREVNASIQIYPFRPFTGNIETAWQTTLLRGWIDGMHKEANVAGQPVFSTAKLPGAQAVLFARFNEGMIGTVKPRMRAVIVSNGAAAVIDITAANDYCWQRIMTSVQALFKSVAIEGNDAAGGPPAGAVSRESSAVSGIFMGYKPKYTVNLNGPSWSGTYPPAPFFYIFSPDGRAFRTFDVTKVPRGGPGMFDYRSVAVSDPLNSGVFRVNGDQIVMQFGRGEVVTAKLLSRDAFTIYGVTYSRQ